MMEDETVPNYVCSICGYVYDPEEEDSPFEDLPDDWSCPVCGALKAQFEKEEQKEDDEFNSREE